MSTKDCRALIVETLKQNPHFITHYFSPHEADRFLELAKKETNWKRASKRKLGEDADYPYTNIFRKEMKLSEDTIVREFYLNPSEFDNAIGFEVLQLPDGSLVMGMDIGD